MKVLVQFLKRVLNLWRNKMDPKGRLRAWLLIEADPVRIDKVRAELKQIDGNDDDAIVIVRMDEVCGDRFNLVAPVDVRRDEENEEKYLEEVGNKLRELEKIDGMIKDWVWLKVTRADPGFKLPHLAAGYITEDEYEEDKDHDKYKDKVKKTMHIPVTQGRQHGSPGFTPWG